MRYCKSVMVIFLLLFVVFVPCLLWAAEGVTESAAETVPGADLMAQILAWLPASWEGWATLVIAACAVIAAAWPRPKEDAHIIWRGLYALVNALAANFGRARNADDHAAKLARLARLGKRLGK